MSERIATITLNRPAARNALSSEVLRLLPRLIKEADGRDDVDGWAIEARDSAAWREAAFDPAKVADRRAAIMDRGRQQ